MKKPTGRTVTFKAQIAPGRNKIGVDGTGDGSNIELLVPETETPSLLEVIAYFRQKRLIVTLEISE